MEEKIAADLQLAEVKRDNLRKAYEQARAHASAVLVLTLQWQDLEEHLDATRVSLQKGLEEMVSREKGVGLKEKLLADAEERVSKEIAVKEEQLGSLQNRIEECSKELKLKNEQLGMKEEELELVDTCLHKCSREVELKQTQLSILEKSVQDCSGELDLKQSQLNRVQSLLDELSKELKSREDQVGRVERLFEVRSMELTSKEGELDKVQQLLVHVVRNISLKEEVLGKVQQQLASKCEELVQRSKEVDSQTKLLEELAHEITSKKNALSDVLTLTKNKSTELVAIQKNIDLLEASVREYSEKLEGKRKLYEEIQRSFQECSRKSRLKNQEYELLRKSVEEECAELRSRQRKYELFRKSLEKSCHSLKLKEQEYELNKRSLDKLFVELRLKENEYESSRISLDKLCTELRSKEKEYELNSDLKSEEKEYEMKRKSLEEPPSESEGKENKLDTVVELLNSLSKELEGKKEQLVSIEGTIKKYCEDVELGEKEFKEIQNSIVAQSEVLKSKEKQLQSIQILIDNGDKELRHKKDEHDSIKKLISECSKELESKVKELNSVQKSLQEHSDELESKVKELNSVQKSLREHSDELESKVKEFLSAQKTVNESLEELKLKEIQLESIKKSVEERIKEVELKEKRLTTTNTSPSKNLQPRDLLLNNAISYYTSPELFASVDGKTLQLFINEHLSRHDLVRAAISAAFSGSSDPAMLVLEAVEGFYPHSGEGSLQFDSVIFKRSCILLLEQLMRISPQIKPQVKEDARMVAHQWKARMTVESNSLDVLAFLQLLATYGLATMFNPDELQSLTNMVAQHSRQVSELRQAFGFNEMEIERSIPCAKIKMEEGESVEVQDAVVSLSVDPQTSASISLLSFLEDHSDVHDSMANEISNALKTALNPALVVLDVIKRSGHQEWENGNKNLEMMNRYILVLQHLMGVSAPISSYVKEEAEKLAIKWKANLRDGTGCSLEVLFFLHFLAVYGLISSFDGDEMLNLLLTVAHHSKAPDLGRVLGFSDKMNDFIESLIKRKQNLEAIAFIYEFQLGDKFSPILLMQKYMQNARTSINRSRRNGKQDLAVEKEAALRAVAKCMSNYKVESKMLSDLIEKRLMELQKQKEDEKTKGTTALRSFDAKDLAQQQSMDTAATSFELQNDSKDHSQLKSYNKVTNSPGIKLQKKVVKSKKHKVHSEQKSLDNKTNTTASNDQSKHHTVSNNATATTATEAKLQHRVVKKESSSPCTTLEQQRSNGLASSFVQLQQSGISAPKHHKPATPAVGVKHGPVTMKRDFRSTFPSKNHAKRERNNKRHKAYTTCRPVNSAWQPQQPRRYFNEGVGNYGGLPPANHHFRVEGGWPNRYPRMQFFCPF